MVNLKLHAHAHINTPKYLVLFSVSSKQVSCAIINNFSYPPQWPGFSPNDHLSLSSVSSIYPNNFELKDGRGHSRDSCLWVWLNKPCLFPSTLVCYIFHWPKVLSFVVKLLGPIGTSISMDLIGSTCMLLRNQDWLAFKYLSRQKIVSFYFFGNFLPQSSLWTRCYLNSEK